MKWQDEDRSDNIEDRRGQDGGGGGGLNLGSFGGGGTGLLFMLFNMFGIRGLLIAGVVLVALKMFGGGIGSSGLHNSPAAPAPPGLAYQESSIEHARAEFVRHVLGSTENIWSAEFTKLGQTYQKPRLVFYNNATPTGCGRGEAAAGPFYCPADNKVYLDLAFFDELKTRFGAQGEFAQAYVVAHEVGHHVQFLLGIDRKVREAQARASQRDQNALQVRMELQADCLAGVWAHDGNEARHMLEQGDIESAMQAAAGVGDDRLQMQSQGRVVPDAFTHGTSAQRQHWLMTGYQSGNINACDTFAAEAL